MTQILHVEDSSLAHAVVMELFRKKGLEYAVDWVTTIADAIKRLEEKQYDLILLDYLLPDGTGLDLLEKAKDTPIVFFTGKGNEVVAVEALQKGAYDYVTKDLDGVYLEVLPLAIERALESVKLKKERQEANAKLREQFEIIQRFNSVMVSRELEMIKLKAEVNDLLEKAGQTKKYEAPDEVKEGDKI